MDVRSEAQIREELTAEFLGRTGLRSLRAGDEIPQIIGMMAARISGFERRNWERRDQHLHGTASGVYLRALLADVLPDPVLPSEPQPGLGGAQIFMRPAADPAPIVIPAGHTVWRSVDSFSYRTQAAATIAGGATTSGPVSVLAQETGEDGNCDIGDIDRLNDVEGVTSTRNTTAITNGDEGDEDDEAREILRSYLRSAARAVRDAILLAVFKVNDPTYGRIQFAKLAAAEATAEGGVVKLYIDDGAGTAGQQSDPGEEFLIQAAGGGEWLFYTAGRPIFAGPGGITYNLNGLADPIQTRYSSVFPWGQVRRLESDPLALDDDLSMVGHLYRIGLVALAQQAVDGVLADVWNYPPVRGVGCIISCEPASLKTATIQCPVSTYSTVTAERDAVLLVAMRNLLAMVNGRDIGEELIQSRAITTINNTSGVKDVPWLTINGLEENLHSLESEVIRSSEPSVSFL